MNEWTKPPPDVEARLRDLPRGTGAFGEPNLAYMNALLNAVERGERFGRRHPDAVEVAAALKATGRELNVRQPGQDDEEVGA